MISDKLIIVAVFLAISGLGLFQILRKKNEICDQEKFADLYLEKLNKYIDGLGIDDTTYQWLIHRSNKMQNQLGLDGICASFRPPCQDRVYSNYPLILNMIPALRKMYNDRFLREKTTTRQFAMSLQDTLLRHQGSLHDIKEINKKSMRNPTIWFQSGVRAIIALPLTLLVWLGALSETKFSRITSGRLFRVVSGLVAFVGFFSAVMGIVTGWEDFRNMVMKIWA